MALTITNPQRFASNFRNEIVDVAFDSSYLFGGESFAPGKTSLSTFYKVEIEPVAGYTFEYDYTNKTIKVFASAPAIVIDEPHTAVAKAVTLDYPAAWIINVATAGQNEALTARADTLADNECKLTSAIASGTRTGITTYGATDAILVSYVTQAWAELYSCLVQEESVALTTGAVNLANTLMCFGYCYGSTTGLLLPVDNADTTASGEVGIKPNYATAALDINAGQNGETGTVTYLKKPASTTWLASRFVADEDPGASGTYIHTFNHPLLMWGITGCVLVDGGTTQKIIDYATAPGAGEATTRWGYRGLVGDHNAPSAGHAWATNSSVTVTAGCYLYGHPWEIPGLVPLEVKNGTDLSRLSSVKVHCFGR